MNRILRSLNVALAISVIFLVVLSCAREPDTRVQPDANQTRASLVSSPEFPSVVTPFTNVAPTALTNGYQLWNDRPGVVVFDYDRDGDQDLYFTTEAGRSNWLYRNEGDGSFVDVAEAAGVASSEDFSTGVVACDIDNDGYQDLYIGAWGDPDDRLDFRSPPDGQGNKDRLFRNNGDGTFEDITDSAFGDFVNYRSAIDIACADVDNDGWVDFYVGNLADDSFRTFDTPSHPGHYNLLYMNNGDLTFSEISERAGVRGPEILMRDASGKPIRFEDPETGAQYEGYDPTLTDEMGNRVGEPTGQTHAVMFFDFDDDGDPDLFVANDGDRLHIYRNDSTPGNIKFTSVARALGIDQSGAWMGFAIGDYDGDADLDVFITNIGFHPRLKPPRPEPGGSCSYHERFAWATCLHYLLRNEGTVQMEGLGTVGLFHDVAPSTPVKPSPVMPPTSLDAANIHETQQVPTGLAAYDFGFGATFFDYDNDGDEDLYWIGSTVARGEGPGGQIFPGAGRMLRGDGQGGFEDITVRAHLLDIVGVDYSILDTDDPRFNALNQKITVTVHENGKGLAHGDLNGDGYVDLIATNSSGPVWDGTIESITPARGPVFVWMNGGGDNHWIILRLKGRMAIDGTGSNADGIGARVYLKAGDKSLVQEVRAGSSYLSMDSVELEFGLGEETLVDEIRVLWPSGRTQTLTDVTVDQVLEIIEPAQ